MTNYTWDKVHELMERQRLPMTLAAAAYAVYGSYYGFWDAFTLVCLCGLSVSGARLLQSLWLQRQRDEQAGGVTADEHTSRAALALAVLLFVQVLVSPDTLGLLVSRWYLLLLTPLLGVALELIKTPRAELSEALANSQINYAQGAAWSFYIGYLMIRFGHGHGTMGENDVPSFQKRMSDYLASNSVEEEDQRLTCKRWIILVPMKHEALLSDNSFSENDTSVKEERKLPGVTVNDRVYGDTQVYCIKNGDRHYRAAMEEASPIRTAALAVEDATSEDFGKEDFEEFARRFLKELRTILKSKPGIADQVEVVPIEDMRKIGSTVVQRILDQKLTMG